jgi:GT2 family glycosyltransferase
MLTVVITDGRGQYLEQTMAAAEEMIPDPWFVIVDDSADSAYARWIDETWSRVPRRIHLNPRRGLGGAHRIAAWAAVEYSDPFCLLLEDDCVLTEPVEAEAMVRTMREHPHLAQLALKRQPGSPEEAAAGGYVQVSPGRWADREGWIEQIAEPLYSFTPHVARCEALQDALDHATQFLEADVSAALTERGWTFGVWGARDDPPRVEHIGVERSAGYRW